MKIKTHSESHVVEMEDGSTWSIFPGDLDRTLHWQPDADLNLVRIDDELCSHALISTEDNICVRVKPMSDSWPISALKTLL